MDTIATEPDDVAAIRACIEAVADAFRAKDTDGILADSAPTLRTFECHSAFELRGVDAYRQFLDACFPCMQGPITFEIKDLEISVDGNVGFAHHIARVVATGTDGEEHGSVVRVTTGFRKTGGKWLTAHVHISAPFNPMTGAAMLDGKSLAHGGGGDAA